MNANTMVPVKLFELPLIAVTRVALGLGIGLLVGDRFNPQERRVLGKTLTLVGALSTIPLAFDVLKNSGLLGQCSRTESNTKINGTALDTAEQKSWAGW